MNIVQPVKLDIVGEEYRINSGSVWLQPFIYFESPAPGEFLGQVLEITAATPTYNVQVSGGMILAEITSQDSTSWAVGDWVLVGRVYGVWKILSAPTMEDMSAVESVKVQVRALPDEPVILEFDSSDELDDTLPSVRISPDANTSFSLYAPSTVSLPGPFSYRYDIMFYHSGTTPFDPVQRQYGLLEVADSITRRTS
jgi:hypothetical protein